MAPTGIDMDVEAQIDSVTATPNQPQGASIPNLAPPANTANPQLPTGTDSQPQATNTNQHHIESAPVTETGGNSQAQRDENRGDSSDGLWSMYLTEAEKQDTEVTESWKGDTDGILVFTGLFSATVATFIIESYQNLSPNSSDTTNALLAQISQQLVDMSNGTPLTSVAAQGSQPFTPTASAVRVNVFWFLSLILSLTCALSATLMQQWARRYQELGQRRGTFHRRGRMRAYIFDGVRRFRMARAVATMPTLLHISVFLFFAGLVEFLFPIQATVAYVTLGCIGAFTLAYAILTVLPNIYLNCPYATPLSGFTWRISQFSVFALLWTILGIQDLYHKSLSKLRRLANQHAPETHGPKQWLETLDKQIKIRRQRFSQSLRKSVELSAYRAESMVVTSALEWTLTALDEDQEIEDFAARMPGFFDSRVVPDATLAVLSLMSHQPNTDPILGSRLYDLLKTCIPGRSLLDEKMRKHRLRICLNCLWYFGRAYNQPGVSQPLSSYVLNSLIPEITCRVRAGEDTSLRVMGHCVVAVIINKLGADLKSRTIPLNDGIPAYLSAILGTKSHDLEFLYHQPGAVTLANMVSLAFGEVGTLVPDAVPPDVLGVVQQTLGIFAQTPLAQEIAEIQLDQDMAEVNGSHGKFESILVSRLLYLFNCTQVPSDLMEELRINCLRTCLKRLWCFGRASNQTGNSVPLPPSMYIAFSNPELLRHICGQRDPAARVIGRCAGALAVSKLAADIGSRTVSASDKEVACLSAILGTEGRSVRLLLRQPGAIALANIFTLVFDEAGTWITDAVPSDALDVVQETLATLSQALPVQEVAELQLEQTIAMFRDSDGKFEHILVSHLLGFLDRCLQVISPLPEEVRTSYQQMCLRGLWYFQRASNQLGNQLGNSGTLPPSICATFSKYPQMSHCTRMHRDIATRELGRCVDALVVNKLAANLNSRTDPIGDVELRCLSAILDCSTNDVVLLLAHRGAIEFTNMAFLALPKINSERLASVPPDVLDVVQQTFGILYQALPAELTVNIRLDQTDALMNVPDGILPLTPDMYKRFLHMYPRNLWNVVKASNERGDSVPLPPYIRVAFTNLAMNRRIRHHDADLSTSVIGCCIEALVVNKLTADINSRNVPVSNDEVACLSTILHTNTDDVMHWLEHPGAIELGGIANLFSDLVSSLTTNAVPLDVLDVVQQTLDFVSQALPAERIVQLQLDQTVSLINDSNSSFERIVSSNLQIFLKACILNPPPLTVEARTSCLRICLKSLWCFTRLYHRFDSPLPSPSYFPLALASPEITHLIRTEFDPAARVMGRCFQALVVDKLATDASSLTDQGVACLSAILDQESHIVWLWLDQRGAIDLRNVISVISDEIDAFVVDELPADVLEIFQQTLSIISRQIARGRGFVDEDLYMDQVALFYNICSIIADRGGPEWLNYRLEGILLQLPAVEERSRRRRSDLILGEQLSEYGADDSSLKSISDSTG